MFQNIRLKIKISFLKNHNLMFFIYTYICKSLLVHGTFNDERDVLKYEKNSKFRIRINIFILLI